MKKKVHTNILKLLPQRQYDRANECYIYEDGSVMDIVGIRCKDLNTQSSDELEMDMLQLTQFFQPIKMTLRL